jgi:hypothetical protein
VFLLHMSSRFYGIDAVANEIDVVLKFVDLGTTIQLLFNKNKTKLLLFKSCSWKYSLSYLCWLYTSGFKCQRPNIFNLARPTREIVHQYAVYRNEDVRPLVWVGTAYREDVSELGGANIRLRGTMNLLVLTKILFHTLSLPRVLIAWTSIF